MFSVDLESGYYHVEISPRPSPVLRLPVERPVLRVERAAVRPLDGSPGLHQDPTASWWQHLRQLGPGARVNIYLDDFLFLISTSEDAMLWRYKMLQALKDFGLHVNFEKSCLTPTKEITLPRHGAVDSRAPDLPGASLQAQDSSSRDFAAATSRLARSPLAGWRG